jgi:hypothetical protein
MKAYCPKCKAQKEIKNEKYVTMKNGNHGVKGECQKCGTKVFRITGK